ncbi:MAG: secretin N-terminal domain-containing protein [Kiritimatiellia bacterium]|jgi:general secretion pathway protein D
MKPFALAPLALLVAASLLAQDAAQAPRGTAPDNLPLPPEAGLNLSTLDRIDVRAFAQMVSDVTGRRFAVAGDVEATFTVVFPDKGQSRLPPDEVYPFFLSVLASANLSVVEDADVARIVRMPEGALSIGTGALASDDDPGTGLVTRVFRLQHIPADDVRRLLEASGARKGGIGVLEEANQVIVTDGAAILARVAALLEEIDRPGQARLTEVVALKAADAATIAAQVNAAMAEGESRGAATAARIPAAPGVNPSSALRSGCVVPAAHANSVILVGSQAQIDKLRALVASLDVEAPTGRGHLNAIFLHYIDAGEAAQSITSLLEKNAAKAADAKDARRIAVEASTANNALMVDASPSDFEVVRTLAGQLDRAPAQVHISVMIAEVADTDGFTWGVGFTALNAPGKKGQTRVSGGSRLFADPPGADLVGNAAAGVLPQGLSLAVAHATGTDSEGNPIVAYPGILDIEALKQAGNVNIVSETALQAQDNIEATVGIVDEIPILKSTVEGGSGASRDYIQNIERQEVGVKIKLTPHVIPGGLVRMELNPSIESVLSNTGGDAYTPTISKRSATTTVTVPDRQTIVIAGLTRTDRQVVDNRIPILGHIPLLGWLFRYKSDVEKKTNLLIFVTPTLVSTPADASVPTEEWSLRTGIVRPGPVAPNEPATAEPPQAE